MEDVIAHITKDQGNMRANCVVSNHTIVIGALLKINLNAF